MPEGMKDQCNRWRTFNKLRIFSAIHRPTLCFTHPKVKPHSLILSQLDFLLSTIELTVETQLGFSMLRCKRVYREPQQTRSDWMKERRSRTQACTRGRRMA